MASTKAAAAGRASRLPIPADALGAHFAVLGKTGAGKTTTAVDLIEELLDAGERCCIVDPTGVYWGLRLTPARRASRFGRVVIFGGAHADVPIGAQHGAAIAEIIGTSSTSAIIDTRLMTVADRTRFFTDFAEALLRKNVGRLRLFIDECHLFMPKGKVADPRSGAMLHAANNLVSLGRGIGLQIGLLSQRPAKVHNDSLGQVETLIAMRMLLPHDREAVRTWIDEWADRERGREILQSLPSMSTGEAWVWAPTIDYLERVAFPMCSTFDSRDPTKTAEAVSLRPINLEAVTGQLAAIAAEAKANDPRALKAEVARLTADLGRIRQNPPKSAAPAPTPSDPKLLEAAEARGYERGFSMGELAEWRRHMEASAADHRRQLDKIAADLAKDREEREIRAKDCAGPAGNRGKARASQPAPPAPPAPKTPAPIASATPDGEERPLTAAQRNVLGSLAWWRGMGKNAPSRNQVAVICGWSTNSSNIRDRCSELTNLGLIERPIPGHLRLTEAGLAAAPARDAGGSLVDSLRLILTSAQRLVFNALLVAGEPMARDDLAVAVGWSPASSNIRDRLSELARLEVIERPRPGVVALQSWVTE